MDLSLMIESLPRLLQGAVLTLKLLLLTEIIGFVCALPLGILYANGSRLVRAPIYGFIIMFFEWWTGLALKAITGYAIWMYTDAGNVMEMTSFYIWPIWMLAGLTIERIYRELMDPGLRAALQQELENPPPPPL